MTHCDHGNEKGKCRECIIETKNSAISRLVNSTLNLLRHSRECANDHEHSPNYQKCVDEVNKALDDTPNQSRDLLKKEWFETAFGFHGCLSGDCPHKYQEECDKDLADMVRNLNKEWG